MYKKVIIVGTGKFAFQCAKIAKKYCEDVSVFENRINDNISVLEKLTTNAGISYAEMNVETIKEMIADVLPDKVLVVSALNTYIFHADFVELPNVRIINFHPALLPMHPGRNAEAWVIYEMDDKTGITWHVVESDVDKGDIIAQEEIDILPTMTSLELMMQQNNLGVRLFERILPDVLEEREERKKQSQKDVKMHFSFEVPNNGYLDMDWEYKKKSAFLRAMDYGKLQVLGTPKIKLNNQTYTWKSYEFFSHDDKKQIQETDLVMEGLESDIILRELRSIHG